MSLLFLGGHVPGGSKDTIFLLHFQAFLGKNVHSIGVQYWLNFFRRDAFSPVFL
jgi:hypothetical protein